MKEKQPTPSQGAIPEGGRLFHSKSMNTDKEILNGTSGHP